MNKNNPRSLLAAFSTERERGAGYCKIQWSCGSSKKRETQRREGESKQERETETERERRSLTVKVTVSFAHL